MPTAAQILSGLEATANSAVWLAVAWHVFVGAVIANLRFGWRPRGVVAAMLLAPMPATVSVLAFMHANVFSGTAFAVLTAILIGAGIRHGRTAVRPAPVWSRWLGVGLIAYAWIYPHFLHASSPALYLVASPMGLIPCPTLAALTGFTLLARPGTSTTWTVTLGLFGLYYAVFGMLRLGVWLDIGLLAGAIALVAGIIKTDLE